MKTIYCARSPFADDIMVVVFVDRGDQHLVAEPVRFRPRTPDEGVAEPTLRLDTTEAQRLMDELWQCGLRPSEGTGSAGALAATQKHLEDMRKIAFDLLVTVSIPAGKPNAVNIGPIVKET
jgi:hypothetical protein